MLYCVCKLSEMRFVCWCNYDLKPVTLDAPIGREKPKPVCLNLRVNLVKERIVKLDAPVGPVLAKRSHFHAVALEAFVDRLLAKPERAG